MLPQSDHEYQRLQCQDEESAQNCKATSAPRYLLYYKVATIFFYALTSLLLTVVNKSILTNYQFPSFPVVAFSQMLTSAVVLYLLKCFSMVEYPDLHLDTFNDIFPLPLLYGGSMLLTLGATQKLSLPTFTFLRRFAIPMTMAAEYYVFSTRPKCGVQLSVSLIVLGGVVAAVDDLSFDFRGYVHLIVADVFVACQAVCTKERLKNDEEMGKYGLMFYSCLFMLPMGLFVVCYTGGLASALSYPSWSDPLFSVQFLLSSTLGLVFTFSTMLCTQYNSALTVSVMSCSKNILATYLGMFIADDYIFSKINFIGINISVFGSLLYAYLIFQPTETTP